MSGRFGKFLNAKGMKIVPSYIGRVRSTAEADVVSDGFFSGTTSISGSSDPVEEANNNRVISQSPSATLEKDYETPVDLTVRSFSFTAFTVFGFSPFSVFGFSPVVAPPFTVFGFSPFTVFGFSPVVTPPFSVFGFSPFTVFGFSPFNVFGFSPISAFSVFGFSPVSFKVFGFSPISSFKVFGFSPVNVLRPADTLEQLTQEENPSDI